MREYARTGAVAAVCARHARNADDSAERRAWAVATRPDLSIDATVASFRDYWVAMPGAKGTKLDWPATFRNWVRAEWANRPGGRTTAEVMEQAKRLIFPDEFDDDTPGGQP